MFSGIQEILVLVLIILGILFLPRIFNRNRAEPLREAKPSVVLSGRMRLGIAASVLWPALIAAFMQPWQKDFFLFLYLGVGPVAIIWIIYWVYIGFRQK
jgi:predicted Na+-dependent transporter